MILIPEKTELHVLEEMNDDSTDIESNNIVNLYQQIPKDIANIRFADFVSKYSVKYKMNAEHVVLGSWLCQKHSILRTLQMTFIDFSEEEVLKHSYVFKNGTEIVKRRKQCILTRKQILRITSENSWCLLPIGEMKTNIYWRMLVLMKKGTWQDKTLFTERDLSMNTNKILLMILNRLVFNNSMGDMRFNEV